MDGWMDGWIQFEDPIPREKLTVSLRLDISQDHVFHSRRHAGYLPRDVRLPAPPRLAQVLQDRARLVHLDALWHHVDDVVHHGRAQLDVEVALNTLLRHVLGDSRGVSPLELPGEKVAEPALEQGDNASKEEEPHAPARGPETDSGTLSHRPGVEAVVDEVLDVLAHPDLPHQPVLVPVHARELPDVVETVLQAVGELERVDVAKPGLPREQEVRERGTGGVEDREREKEGEGEGGGEREREGEREAR